MKNLLTLALLTISICIHAQGDVLAIIQELNNLPERVEGYSKMVKLSYTVSYDEEAPVDTTIVNSDGTRSELSLSKKSVVIFGESTDVEYNISIADNDTTMITTTTYNKNGQILTQNQDLGDDEVSAMFNADKSYTYDDKGRMLTMTNTAGDESNGGVFTYNEDGLPQTLAMDLGMGKFKVNRVEMDGYFNYELSGEMSDEMKEMMAMMGKTMDDMPKEYFEVRKKGELYELKQMKEVGEEKKITLQAITVRDVKGNLHEEINYNDEELVSHKKNTYINGKLTVIENVLEDTKQIIHYNKNGKPLNAFEDFEESTMTYNQDGLLLSKMSTSAFSEGVSKLEVTKYYK